MLNFTFSTYVVSLTCVYGDRKTDYDIINYKQYIVLLLCITLQNTFTKFDHHQTLRAKKINTMSLINSQENQRVEWLRDVSQWQVVMSPEAGTSIPQCRSFPALHSF